MNDKKGRLEEEIKTLRDANALLVEQARARSAFLSVIAHEMRTPLTSVIGYAEMLMSGLSGSLNDEQQQHLAAIREKGDSLLALIGQILDLARVESSKLTLHRENVLPGPLMRLALTDVVPQAQKGDVKIVANINDDLPPAFVDADKLRRIATNLLANAVKYTPAGGQVEIVLTRQQRSGSDMLCLEVKDSGVGISKKALPHIFDGFYRAENVRSRGIEGTGLGLSIVRSYVEAHAGRVSVDSVYGQGSTFQVLLPYASPDVAA